MRWNRNELSQPDDTPPADLLLMLGERRLMIFLRAASMTVLAPSITVDLPGRLTGVRHGLKEYRA